jgi:hypothetical protein
MIDLNMLIAPLVLGVYFLPAIVAAGRRHERELSVMAMNLLFGWTVIGWIVALRMALEAPKAPQA